MGYANVLLAIGNILSKNLLLPTCDTIGVGDFSNYASHSLASAWYTLNFTRKCTPSEASCPVTRLSV